MKEENQNVKEREIAEDQIDFRALLFKYIIHWPWFVGAVLLCLVGAWFYLHWATPIYNISSSSDESPAPPPFFSSFIRTVAEIL